MSDETTPALAEQVAAESAKRAAKKAASRPRKKAATKAGPSVKVVMLVGSRATKAGATRTLPAAQAATLIREGHARKADK